MTNAADKAGKGQQCLKDVATIGHAAAKDADQCEQEIRTACAGIESADKEAKKCAKAKKDAEDKANRADQKGKEAGDNSKKGGDNAKNENSAGGMPQMPQIPQQQQQPEESPQQQADYPQGTSPTPASENKAPELQQAKFDGDKDKTAVPNVGFGNTTPSGPATVTPPAPSVAAHSFDSSRGISSNGFGNKPEGATVAAAANPQGGGGGGGMNSSGASLPGTGQGTGEDKKSNEANPYEMPVGSGGRLGVPKGKTGGENDSVLDSAATTAFKDDFKADSNAGAGAGMDVAAAGAEEDGYTIFKMVKYRYTELKKRGGI